LTRLAFKAGLHAIKGGRRRQEDAAIIVPPGRATYPDATQGVSLQCGDLLIVLADGMGGHAGGETASRTVCEAMTLSLAEAAPDQAVANCLLQALRLANKQVGQAADNRPDLHGMGTTALGVCFSETGLAWVSVGDSPLYLIRNRELALLNEDHSLAPALDQLVEMGRLSPQDARNDPRRHMLRSAVTGEELDLIDVCHQPLALEPGDVIIAASDGIHAIESDEIARIATAYAHDGPDAIAEALLRAVMAIGDPSQDNTTLAIVTTAPASDAI